MFRLGGSYCGHISFIPMVEMGRFELAATWASQKAWEKHDWAEPAAFSTQVGANSRDVLALLIPCSPPSSLAGKSSVSALKPTCSGLWGECEWVTTTSPRSGSLPCPNRLACYHPATNMPLQINEVYCPIIETPLWKLHMKVGMSKIFVIMGFFPPLFCIIDGRGREIHISPVHTVFPTG